MRFQILRWDSTTNRWSSPEDIAAFLGRKYSVLHFVYVLGFDRSTAHRALPLFSLNRLLFETAVNHRNWLRGHRALLLQLSNPFSTEPTCLEENYMDLEWDMFCTGQRVKICRAQQHNGPPNHGAAVTRTKLAAKSSRFYFLFV